MKITINSTELSHALAAVARCVSNKSILPILECVHIEAIGEQLRITTSDNENWFSIGVQPTDITYLDDGFNAFCIESKRFLAIIRELPSQPIGLETTKGCSYATLRWINGEAQIPILFADEYPMPVMVQQQDNATVLPIDTVKHVIENCSFATANDELRPVMNGIYFDNTEGFLTCCATNGYILARMKYTVKATGQSFILPNKSANLLGVFINEIERNNHTELKVIVNGNNIVFSTLNNNEQLNRLICRKIEGRYPNYNNVIPKNSSCELEISRLDLVAALKRTIVFANAATLLVKLKITENQLTISASDINFVTSSEEQIGCAFNGQEEFLIGFKGSLLLDILKHFKEDEIKILLTDHTKAAVFTTPNKNDNCEPLMLLVPMVI